MKARKLIERLDARITDRNASMSKRLNNVIVSIDPSAELAWGWDIFQDAAMVRVYQRLKRWVTSLDDEEEGIDITPERLNAYAAEKLVDAAGVLDGCASMPTTNMMNQAIVNAWSRFISRAVAGQLTYEG